MATPKSKRQPILEEHRARERQQRDAVIAEFDAGDTEATMQAMATAIVEHRRALALLARAIAWAETGAPFALLAPGPLAKPKPRRGTSESFDQLPASE